MERVFVGIGSNLGDAQSQVESAISQINRASELEVIRSASLYGSKPFGPVEQDDFVNTVIEIACSLEPLELLNTLKEIERTMGRAHGVRWGPREIDLDILLFGSREYSSDDLNLPHAGIAERAFVLVPLAELEPELVLADGLTIGEAISRLEKGLVWPLQRATTINL
jgi:2-amino-4-hydroxy-6-hydroxymethyldihydropteridine diphosphokinase